MNMQSNALRGEYMQTIVDKTVNEIHDDLLTVFGPGAADAFIVKDGKPYYTRDGLEVLESLTFDNRLSETIRTIIYQASRRQGDIAGDGTTTLIMFYTNLYHLFRKYAYCMNLTATELRRVWNDVVTVINKELSKNSVEMTDEYLKGMLFTCTQDADLSAKIYHTLKEPILNGAYIIPTKSNIESDFEVETYQQPLIKATRQWALKPIKPIEMNTIIFHCNGMLDIAHSEILYGLGCLNVQDKEGGKKDLTIVILCNGITEATRRSTKELISLIKTKNIDTSIMNNVAIYTLDNYRTMDGNMIEDLSTILTDEEGIGGLVNSLTFESLLYQSLYVATFENFEPIEDLATFDCDLRFIDKIHLMVLRSYRADFDDAEGIRLYKPLGPVAQARYDKLREAIKTEKSTVAKYQYQKRLKNVYGQFIEVQVGSKLLKESQRKYELVLDAIVSSAEAVRYGVLSENSILKTIKVLVEYMNTMDTTTPEFKVCYMLTIALGKTAYELVKNVHPSIDKDICGFGELMVMEGKFFNYTIDRYDHKDSDMIGSIHNMVGYIMASDISLFNLYSESFLQALPLNPIMETKSVTFSDPDAKARYDTAKEVYEKNMIRKVEVDDQEISINTSIVEPVSIMTNIMENSFTPIELALSKTFHVADFMGNYL